MSTTKTTTNIELETLCKKLPFFRGVFMRDDFTRKKPWTNELAIVNLDSRNGPGTHWVAYIKLGRHIQYFDSFGNLQPPIELIHYFGPNINISYNHERFQNYNESICGQLCVKFLREKARYI